MSEVSPENTATATREHWIVTESPDKEEFWGEWFGIGQFKANRDEWQDDVQIFVLVNRQHESPKATARLTAERIAALLNKDS